MKSVLLILLILVFLPSCSSTTSENDGVSANVTKKKVCFEKKSTGSRIAKKVCKT